MSDTPFPFVAAVDLGSNSFHMIVAREDEGGALLVVDRLREPVRLADRLGETKRIHPEAQQRALECLARFGQRLRDFPSERVRAVGTNTLRRAHDADLFLAAAERELGHSIEVISGIEEARLIYSGVASGLGPERERRLVMDIGGGSTEVIAGKLAEPKLMESLNVGCVTYSERYFPKGKLSRKSWNKAVLGVEVKLEPLVKRFQRHNWDVAVGSSGTIRVIESMLQEKGHPPGITRKGVRELGEQFMESDSVDDLEFESLSKDRRPIIAGGLAILHALFESLKIDQLETSERALRDGLLNDLVGRLSARDVRAESVRALASRFEVEPVQAESVTATAQELFRQVRKEWDLEPKIHGALLGWAAALHEIGLAVAHSKYNVHGAYLVTHCDIPGFSQTEQRILAALIQ
ncbi:MAG: exopolyphosphatase, partial [Nevskiales bacterium]